MPAVADKPQTSQRSTAKVSAYLVGTLVYCACITAYYLSADARTLTTAATLLLASLWAIWIALVFVTLRFRKHWDRGKWAVAIVGGAGVCCSALLYLAAGA